MDILEREINLDKKVRMLCGSSINWHQHFGKVYETVFYLIFLLVVLTCFHIFYLDDLCNEFFNIFEHFLHIKEFYDKFGLFKWLLGQESCPYTLCLGVTFQG